MDRQEIIERAISAYGMDAKILMAVEEMSELTKALCKVSRTIGTDKYAAVLENVKEEVADVQIMLDQVRAIFRFHTEAIEQAKLRRLEERLNGRKPCPLCAEDEHSPFCFDAYVPVSADGDIIEKSNKPGEEWVFHARFCPECGRRL